MARSLTLAKLFIDLEANTKGLQGEMERAERSFGRIGDFIRKNPVAAIVSLGAAAGAAALKLASMAADFEEHVAALSVTLSGTDTDIRGLANGVLELYKNMPVKSLDELAAGLNNIVAAGIPAGDALDVLKVAAEAAIGGVASTDTVVKGLTTTINAFATQGVTAQEAADAFFVAVREGDATFEEFAGSIGRVAGTAAGFGVTLDDLVGTTAALTLGGIKTDEAMTALSAVFSNIAKPTEQLKRDYPELAKSFDLTALRTKGLVGFLTELAPQLKGNDDLAIKMFGSVRAFNAVLALTSDGGERLTRVMGAMAEKTGASKDAYDKMSQTTNALHQQLKNQFTVALIEIGQIVLPAVNLGLQATVGLMQGLLSLIDLIKNKGSAFSGFVMGPTEIKHMQEMLQLPIFGGKPIDLTNLQVGSREFKALASAVESVAAATHHQFLPAFNASEESLVAMRATVEAYAKTHVRSLDATAPATEALAARYLKMLRTLDAEIAKRKKNPDGPPPLDKPGEEKAKERAKALEEIQKLSNESALSLLTAQHREFLALTERFNSQIAKLQGEDRRRGEEALQQAQRTLLTKWADFNRDLIPQVTRGTTTVRDNSQLQARSLDELGDAFSRFAEEAQAAASSAEGAALRKQAVLQEIGDVATAYRGASDMLLGIADEYGLLDDKLRAIGESIGGIATAVSQFASGDGIGGTITGLSAIATVLKGVLGPSPEATRAREILERNSRVIEENTRTILRNTPGATFASIGQLLGGLFGEGGTGLGALTVGAGRPRVDEGRIRGFLVGELTKMGLSFSEFEQLAKDVGIQLDLSTIDRANDTLRHFFVRLGQVSTTGIETLEEHLARIRTGISIGAIDANQEFAETLKVLRGLKKPPAAILEAIGGIDVRTQDGAAGAIAKLRGLFTDLPSLSDASLGDLTRDQFTSLIAQLIGLLESGSTLRSTDVDLGGDRLGPEFGDSPPTTPKTKAPVEPPPPPDPTKERATREQGERIRDLMAEFGFDSKARGDINKALASGLVSQAEADELIRRIREDILDAATEDEAAAYRQTANDALAALEADLKAGRITEARYATEGQKILDTLAATLGPGLTKEESVALAEPFAARYREWLLKLDDVEEAIEEAAADLGAVMAVGNDTLDAVLEALADFEPVPPPVLSADLLKTLTAPSTNTVNMTVSIGDIVIQLPAGLPVEDPRALAAELSESIVERIDEALARRAADAAMLRGDSRR